MPDSSRKKTKTAPARKPAAKAAPARTAAKKPAPAAKEATTKAAAPVKPAPKPPVAPKPQQGKASPPPLVARPTVPAVPVKPAAAAAGKLASGLAKLAAAVSAVIPGKGVKPTAPAPGAPGAPVAGAKPLPGKPGDKPVKPPKKGGRKTIRERRGPDGELLAPGELLLPGGPTSPDEIQYLLRGSVAAEHAAAETGVSEIILKKGPQAEPERRELLDYAGGMGKRFDTGPIEPLLPLRAQKQRNFLGVVERAKHRRREIGAFLRGLDLGKTEISHMDSHGEASMQSLMEWAARLEVLSEADEPEKADYTQFLRVLDQLDATTESLIVDVELTLRRLRDRVKTKH
jgi:hypothetical protein